MSLMTNAFLGNDNSGNKIIFLSSIFNNEEDNYQKIGIKWSVNIMD